MDAARILAAGKLRATDEDDWNHESELEFAIEEDFDRVRSLDVENEAAEVMDVGGIAVYVFQFEPDFAAPDLCFLIGCQDA